MVAVVDHHLPAMDGCYLLELIATDEQLRARLCFIFITGSPPHVLAEDCGETLDELAAPVMRKPIDIDDVLEAVAATRLPTG